jgi:hypothetical protein
MPDAPKPAPTLVGESAETAYWLDSAYSLEDIAIEWDYLFEEIPMAERLGEVWLRPRWTTPIERADPERLYDLFGDFEDSGCDTSVVYDLAKPNSEGVHRYWTTEYRPKDLAAQGEKDGGC